MNGRVLLLGAAFVAMTGCAASSPDTSAVRAGLEADAAAWFEHYNAGDAAAVASLYSEDAVVLPDRAAALNGRTAIREYLVGDIAETKAAGLAVRNGQFTGFGVSGDLAWLSGTSSAADASGTIVDTGKYLSVYQRSGGEWLIIRDIWNSDTAPATVASTTASQ